MKEVKFTCFPWLSSHSLLWMENPGETRKKKRTSILLLYRSLPLSGVNQTRLWYLGYALITFMKFTQFEIFKEILLAFVCHFKKTEKRFILLFELKKAHLLLILVGMRSYLTFFITYDYITIYPKAHVSFSVLYRINFS